MIGLGTIVNTLAIVIGGILGRISGRLLKQRYQETVMKIIGFAVIVMALGGVLSQMIVIDIVQTNGNLSADINTQGTLMMITSLALGTFVGEVLNCEHLFERFGNWLRQKSGNQEDNQFIDAFLTATLTVCVGAMAVLGSIQDGLIGDPNTLFAKAILDFIIIMIMTSALGKGCIYSAIPVALFQGTITLLAQFIAPIMTETAVSNLSLVGNVCILCVGVNLIWPKTIRVANVLPAILFAVLFALI